MYRYGNLNLLEVEELQGKMFGNSEGCQVELYKDEKWRVSDSAVFGIDVKVHDIYPVLKYREEQSTAVGGASGTAVGGVSVDAVGGASVDAVGGTATMTTGGSNEEVKIDDLDSAFAKVTTRCVHSGLITTLGGEKETLPATGRQPSLAPVPPTISEDNFDQMRAGLLSKVVEHISLLIDDWFVGVRPRSIVVPCPHCMAAKPKGPVTLERSYSTITTPSSYITAAPSSPNPPGQVIQYLFDYEDCVVAARSQDYVECPAHGNLPLAYIAPDTVGGTHVLLGVWSYTVSHPPAVPDTGEGYHYE